MRQATNTRRRPAAVPALAAAAVCAAAFALAAGEAAAQTQGPEVLGFTKHFAVEITNPSPLALENHAVVIEVADIRASVAADFNSYMYAFFDNAGGEYALVVSQADDLDKDRYHDELVIVRTLPPSSTTRLLCYYTPTRSYQLMPTQKAFARGAWEAGGAEAGWESNLAAFKFVHGRIGLYGKLQPGLILKGFPAAETKSKDWGMDVLAIGESAGLGGLSLWDGAARVPLFGPSAPPAKLTVISPGPVRGLVKAEYPAVKTAGGDVTLTVYFSAFSDNVYSRQDVVIASKAGAPVVFGPGIQKLAGETVSLDNGQGPARRLGQGSGQGRRDRPGRHLPAGRIGRDRRCRSRSRPQAHRHGRRQGHVLDRRGLGARRHRARRPGGQELGPSRRGPGRAAPRPRESRVQSSMTRGKKAVEAPYDPGFQPIFPAWAAYLDRARACGATPLRVAIEREDGLVSVFDAIAPAKDDDPGSTYRLVERVVKFLLWSRGGWRIHFQGPAAIGRRLRTAYSESGERAFDARTMGGVYERPFEVALHSPATFPEAREATHFPGGYLDGFRIGFDLGASDYKVAAVIDGQPVWSEEIPVGPGRPGRSRVSLRAHPGRPEESRLPPAPRRRHRRLVGRRHHPPAGPHRLALQVRAR